MKYVHIPRNRSYLNKQTLEILTTPGEAREIIEIDRDFVLISVLLKVKKV
jgi:hypothetical protein